MFNKSERNSPDDHKTRERRRSRSRYSAHGSTSGPGALRTKSVQRSFRHLAYEMLETRRLLSGVSDLTGEITQLLNNNQTSAPTNLGTVSLGNDLTFNNVTVSFAPDIVQTGSNWTAAVTVSATSASLTVGSGATAEITGTGGNPGISGSYTLTNQPASEGAYQLTASQFDLTLSNLLTANSTDVTIDYSPAAAAGQELVQIGSLSATILPLDNAMATVDDLDIFDDHFTLGDGNITAGPITLGNILSIDQPSLQLAGVGYSAGAFTGTIGLTASSASLFPGEKDFSASADALTGSYDLASQKMTLSADNVQLSIGNILDANASELSFTLDDSTATPTVTLDAQNFNVKSPDFPSLTGTIGDLSGNNTGFTTSSVSLSSSGDITFGKILDVSSPTLSLSDFAYTIGATPAVTGTFTVGGTVKLFPGQSSFSTTVDDFSASYSIGSASFGIRASEIDLNVGKLLTATTGPVAFTFDDSTGTPAVTFDVQNVAVTSPDFPTITGTIGDLSASNTGFSVSAASLSSSGDITFGKILDVSSPTLSLSDFAYTIGATPAVTGTFTVGGTVKLFPGQSSFSTTVDDFSASYDIASANFGITASAIALQLGNLVTATTGPVKFDFVDASGSPSVSFDVQDVKLKSPDFPNLSGKIGDLSVGDSGFMVSSASLSYSGETDLGSVLSITGLTLGIESFDYSTTDDSVSGTINFGATSVSLLAGQSAFSTTVSDPSGKSTSGLSGSYDINTQAFGLQLDEIDIKVSDILEVTADDVALNVAPGSFSMTVGSAMASVPKLAGFQGTVSNLAITNDGFSIGSATLGLTGSSSAPSTSAV